MAFLTRLLLNSRLRQGDKSLVGNKDYRRYLKVQGDHHFAIDEKQIKTEARYDESFSVVTIAYDSSSSSLCSASEPSCCIFRSTSVMSSTSSQTSRLTKIGAGC